MAKGAGDVDRLNPLLQLLSPTGPSSSEAMAAAEEETNGEEDDVAEGSSLALPAQVAPPPIDSKRGSFRR